MPIDDTTRKIIKRQLKIIRQAKKVLRSLHADRFLLSGDGHVIGPGTRGLWYRDSSGDLWSDHYIVEVNKHGRVFVWQDGITLTYRKETWISPKRLFVEKPDGE